MNGILGKPDLIDIKQLEAACRELSKKDIKVVQKDNVKFDPKEKGQKPIVTKGIL